MDKVYVVFYTLTNDYCNQKETIDVYANKEDAITHFDELVKQDKKECSESLVWEFNESENLYESWDTDNGYASGHCNIWLRETIIK